MKQLLGLVVGTTVVLIGVAHVKSAGPSVVTVSLQRVSAQSDIGKRANQQLETLRQERGRELTAKQKELEEVVRQLTRTEALPPADRDRLSQDESRGLLPEEAGADALHRAPGDVVPACRSGSTSDTNSLDTTMRGAHCAYTGWIGAARLVLRLQGGHH